MTDYINGRPTLVKQAEDAARRKSLINWGAFGLGTALTFGGTWLLTKDFNEESYQYRASLSASVIEPEMRTSRTTCPSSNDGFLSNIVSANLCP